MRYPSKEKEIIKGCMMALALLFCQLHTTVKAQDSTGFKVLPVTFHKFQATIDNQKVQLYWTVDTDDIFPYYRIERSFNGRDYKEIGRVATAASVNPTEISSYGFCDTNIPESGIIYYRLSWTELNGKTYFSPVKLVLVKGQGDSNKLVTYPNPVQDQLKITLPDDWQGEAVIFELYTSTGSRVRDIRIKAAGQTEMILLPEISRGFYLLIAKTKKGVLKQNILKD